MTLAELADIAAILSVILLAITFLIDRWPQMIQRGKPYLPKISLAFLIMAIISAGYSYYASRYIIPSISKPININGHNSKLYYGQILPFDYEEITVTKEKAVGLSTGRLKALERSTHKRYIARVNVADSAVTYLYTGGEPTSDTKNILYPGSSLLLDSLTAMKQFRAIGKDGTGTLAVNYFEVAK